MQPEISKVMRSDARRSFILVVSSCWAWTWRRSSSDHGSATSFAKRETLDYIKDGGNEEDAEGTGCEHAPDHGCAHDLAGDRTCTGGGPERDAAENEGEGGHENGTQSQAGTFESGIDERFAFFILILGKFDDEDGVFSGETDQH